MGISRSALPFVQRLLPLLDSNFATAVSNLITPHPHPQGRRWPARWVKPVSGFSPLCGRSSPINIPARGGGQARLFPVPEKSAARFSQPALLMYIHALFYGPDSTHRYLLPRLKNFVHLDA